VADVGVDLGEEGAADDHRLERGMVDVGGEDGAAARNLVTDEFRGHELRYCGAEAVAVGERLGGGFRRLPAAEVLALGDVDHLLGDDAGAGALEPGTRSAASAPSGRP